MENLSRVGYFFLFSAFLFFFFPNFYWLAKEEVLASSKNIIFNEILPSPNGPDEKEEWIEIFNQSDSEIDLSGWKVTDTDGKTKTYIFPKGTKIQVNGFLLLLRPNTKITLNNDGDGLKLIQPDGKIEDEVIYKKAHQGQSFNRTVSGSGEINWVWSSTLSPGSPNIITEKGAETREKKESIPRREMAAIGEQITKSPRFLSVFLTAFALAISFGTILLFLKKNLKKIDFLEN
jgi:hypothetical protein